MGWPVPVKGLAYHREQGTYGASLITARKAKSERAGIMKLPSDIQEILGNAVTDIRRKQIIGELKGCLEENGNQYRVADHMACNLPKLIPDGYRQSSGV